MTRYIPHRVLEQYAREMRREPTHSEGLLWMELRYRQMGCAFLFQEPILGYIVDFYAPNCLLAVEVDGSIHQQPEMIERDRQREITFLAQGIKTLRFTNEDVVQHMSVVLHRIKRNCAERRGFGVELQSSRDTSSNSRHGGLLEKQSSTLSAHGFALKSSVDEVPPEQRITVEEAEQLFSQFSKFARQKTMDFGDYKRPMSEKAWEQKLKLAPRLFT